MSQTDLIARLHHLAAVLAIDVIVLADGPFHQDAAGVGHSVVVSCWSVFLAQRGYRMMNDLAAGQSAGPNLDRTHPALFIYRHDIEGLPPHVLPMRGHGVRDRLNHDFGLAELLGELPLVASGPLLRSRQILRVTERRAGIHPAGDGIHLLVGQGSVVLETLDANALVDVPGRHVPANHALFDGPRPGADFFVRHQRHRRRSPRAMALLALGLENRGDVFREGYLFCCIGGGLAGLSRGRDPAHGH